MASPSTNFEPILDIDQAAELLRIHPRTLQKKAIAKELPAFKMGKYWRFRASELNEWVQQHRN